MIQWVTEQIKVRLYGEDEFPTYHRSVLWTDAASSSLLSPSPPHLSTSSLGWKSDLIQARGGGGGVVVGGGGFQVPLLNGSLCQDPWAINMTMWQCGRAFLKRDPVFVKCFPPEEPPWGGSGDLKVPVKARGQLWSHNVKRTNFLINLSQRGSR